MAELDKQLFSTSIDNVVVDIDMLDFEYVANCSDWQKLYKILQTLRSGKEGHYPELMAKTEDKMLEVMPHRERKRYLALNTPATPNEIVEAEIDLLQWQMNASRMDEQLLMKSTNQDGNEKRSTVLLNFEDSSSEISTSLDFESHVKILNKSQISKLKEARETIKFDKLSSFQRDHKSELERRKGNEFFKASEYDEAIKHYTFSIALSIRNDVLWSNRAIAYIKKQLFDLAEMDCQVALTLNPNNIKALTRRGFSRISQGKYREAAFDYSEALKVDPNNSEYEKLLAKALEKYHETEGVPLDMNALKENRTKRDLPEDRFVQKSASSVSPSERVSLSLEECNEIEDLLLPSVRVSFVSKGILNNISHKSSEEEDFVRITIEEDEDEEEEENKTSDYKKNNEKLAEDFVRIPIEDGDDDSDSDNKSDSATNQEFVRIPIDADDDSDDTGSDFVSIKEEKCAQLSVQSEFETEANIDPSASLEIRSIQLKDYGNKIMAKGDYKKAIQVYEESLRLSFSILTLNNRAQAKLSMKDFPGAVSDSTDVLKLEPNNLKALFRRAKANSELGYFIDCMGDLKRIVELDPTNAAAKKLASEVESQYKQQLFEENCSKSEELKAKGNLATQENDFIVAISLYSQAIELNPKNVAAINNRSLAYLKTRNFDLAIKDASTVLTLCSDSALVKPDQVVAIKSKALYRRAEAQYHIGVDRQDETSLLDGLEDLKHLGSFDKDNLSAKDLENLISASLSAIDAAKAKSKESEFESKVQSPVGSRAVEKSPSKKSPSPGSKQARTKLDLSNFKVELPSATPKSLYEFERVWRSMLGDDLLRLDYLKMFKKATFKKIFKEAISLELLGSIFDALKSTSADVDLVVKVLRGLKEMGSFNLTISLLEQEYIHTLSEVFIAIREKAIAIEENKVEILDEINSLQSDYKIFI